MKRLFLYDLDGTLVDTKDDITQAANHMLNQMGAAPLSREEVCRFVGVGLKTLVASCLKTQDPKRIEEGSRIYRAFYAHHLLDKSRLYLGAHQTLEYFKDRKQVVITNKPNPFSREILEGLGVAHYFLEIIAGDAEYPRKPDPSAILAVMKESGIPPQEALFIGDSPIDVQTGRNAGVTTVIITHGFSDGAEISVSQPDVMVRNFKELLDLAKRRGW